MLKTTGLLDELALSKNNGSKSASSKNNNIKPAFKKNNSNGEVNKFGVGKNGVEHTKKSRKLSKSGKSKSKKTAKSQNLAKSRKKLSKSGISTNFNTTRAKPKFLISDAKTTFNRLWLAFTKASILWHFDLEYYIWIRTNALSYTISEILS